MNINDIEVGEAYKTVQGRGRVVDIDTEHNLIHFKSMGKIPGGFEVHSEQVLEQLDQGSDS